MSKTIINQLFAAFSFVLIVSFVVSAQQKVPSPAEVIGFTPGDDRKLASWNQVLSYFQKLEDTSPRVNFEAIGKTTMDAPFAYATISSPQNLKDLERYRSINAKLADPRLIKSDDKLAKKMIADGKAIVLITCGIHSTEVFCMQDGVTAYLTEYATLISGSPLGNFSIGVSGGNVNLTFSPINPDNNIITLKVIRYAVTS